MSRSVSKASVAFASQTAACLPSPKRQVTSAGSKNGPLHSRDRQDMGCDRVVQNPRFFTMSFARLLPGTVSYTHLRAHETGAYL
eukprot:1937530-Pyramimonas_sp.AAC.1